MEFTDFLIIKFIVIVAAAFVWGIYCGVTGRPLWPEQHDTQEKRRD
jgi:hypothetical protein